jgi:uncharacterized surface protein with fasciclin (FAS1) repeats
MPDIVDIAVGAGSFSTLVAAVQAAGLVETLKSPGPFTVFAPNDEAFAKLPPGTIQTLVQNIPQLTRILTFSCCFRQTDKSGSSSTRGGNFGGRLYDSDRLFRGF